MTSLIVPVLISESITRQDTCNLILNKNLENKSLTCDSRPCGQTRAGNNVPVVSLSRTNKAPRLILNSQVLERGRISESHLKSENSTSITGNAVVVCEMVFECLVLTSLKEPASSLKFKCAKTWSLLKIDSFRWLSASSPRNSSSSVKQWFKRLNESHSQTHSQ